MTYELFCFLDDLRAISLGKKKQQNIIQFMLFDLAPGFGAVDFWGGSGNFSVSDPYSSNPDPAKNFYPDPEGP